MRYALVLLLLAPAASAEMFSSGDIAPGESWSYTFTEVNEQGHTYHCHPHPWMQAMVHVVEDSDGETKTLTVNIVEGANRDDWGYEPAHPVIEVGDTITWVNQGAAVHTVDEDEGTGDHDHDHDHSDHDHDEDSPGLPFVALLLAVVGLALRRR